jgi:arylformamidase
MLNPDIFLTDTPSTEPLLSQLPEREKEYSPSSAIGGNYQPYVQAYVDRSREAYHQVKCIKDIRYGDAERALMDYFPAPQGANSKPGLLVFIHGGYWQELSKNESSFLAPAWHAAGFAHAVVGYTLAPQATLFEIVAQCRAAVAYLRDQAEKLGHDASRIVVAGSSAGGYLAAACASDASLKLRGFVPISGVFDLRPLVGTSINDAVGLTLQDAAQLSRITAGAARVPGVVAWGAIETQAFKQQSQSLAAHLRAQGQRCTELELAGRNHFDVVHELGDAQSPLFKAALNLFDAEQFSSRVTK